MSFKDKGEIVVSLCFTEAPDSKGGNPFTTDDSAVASLFVLGAVGVIVHAPVLPWYKPILATNASTLVILAETVPVPEVAPSALKEVVGMTLCALIESRVNSAAFDIRITLGIVEVIARLAYLTTRHVLRYKGLAVFDNRQTIADDLHEARVACLAVPLSVVLFAVLGRVHAAVGEVDGQVAALSALFGVDVHLHAVGGQFLALQGGKVELVPREALNAHVAGITAQAGYLLHTLSLSAADSVLLQAEDAPGLFEVVHLAEGVRVVAVVVEQLKPSRATRTTGRALVEVLDALEVGVKEVPQVAAGAPGTVRGLNVAVDVVVTNEPDTDAPVVVVEVGAHVTVNRVLRRKAVGNFD